MKLIIQLLFIFLFSYPSLLIGQQLSLFTQYRNQLSILNPAGISVDYILENFNTSVVATQRNQWIGIEAHPVTSLISIKSILLNEKILVGAYFMNDKAGAIGNTKVNGNFAYFLINNRRHKLSVGFNVGWMQYRVNLNEIKSYKGGSMAEKRNSLDFGAGLFYVHNMDKKKFYVGFAIPQLKEELISNNIASSVNAQAHLLVTLGGYFPIRGETTFFEPSLLISKVAGVPLHVNANARFKFLDNFWLGGGAGTSLNTDFQTLNYHLETGVIIRGNSLDRLIKIGISYYGTTGNNLKDNILGPTYEVNMSIALDW